LNVLDLFSGIGGFSIGLERVGMRTVAFCEIDPRARKVLAKHWPEVPIFEDVRTIDHEGIDANVICGGFPCQDISLAGEGAGLAGERSGLWRELLRAIRVVRPDFAIVENVAALLGRGMDVVLGDLAEIGYDAEWHCIRASDLGAPHERDRVWIVAYPFGSRGARLVTSADLGTAGPWRLRSQEDLQYLTDPPFERGDSWPQPLLRRMDDGISHELDLIGRLERGEVNNQETKSETEAIIWHLLRAVWEHHAIAAPSPEIYCGILHNCLPKMSYGDPCSRWLVGARLKEDQGLCDLWQAFYAKPFEEAQDMQRELLERIRKKKRPKALVSRADRLHLIGNSIVPQIAEAIGRAIMTAHTPAMRGDDT